MIRTSQKTSILKKHNRELSLPSLSITKTRVLFRLSILLLTLTLIFACKDKTKSSELETKKERIQGVSVSTITLSTIDEVYELTGNVRSRLSGNVSARVVGEVKEVYVKEGDLVKEGQILIKIDDSDVREKVKAAEKGLESARHNMEFSKKTYERYKTLYDEKAVSGQEFDQIKTQMTVAQSEFERAKAMLNEALTYQRYTSITAPYDGVITSKNIEKGNVAVVGAPLFNIEGIGSYYIEVNVDESMSGKIKTGLPLIVKIDGLNKEYKAKVTEVVPSVDPKTRSFITKIDISGQGIRSGMFTRVLFTLGKRDAILIDKNCIVKKGQLTGVYAVDDKTMVSYRLVKLGSSIGDKVEVLSGLKPNDKIISSGIEKVVEGGFVEVAGR
ncbi:MAG: efflux RND transporter periplasmic adaptor subunit [Thermodesulfovibrionales bacterium]|nr:efflux RND transporter periplasmic adaptor subunit [Thermodesulfovibrionales bacterium]